MKIAISSVGPDLDAQIDPRFGRCQYFLIVDPDTYDFEALENPNIMAMGGAGIQSAQMVANKGAEVVISGNYGPNAFQTLSAAGVKMISGVTGTVREAIEKFKRGELQPLTQATVPSHFGAGAGMGGGMGGGMGRGMGGGRGMGRGAGRGMATGYPSQQWQTPMSGAPQQAPTPGAPQPAPGGGSKEELEALRSQMQSLGEQLKQINSRIRELEKKK